MENKSNLKSSVIQYCLEISSDPLLVQGAGGNVSWKEGNILWIKASGTWLSDAADGDIFVPVDLTFLRKSIDSNNFSVSPQLTIASDLRPSIETLLHALMPHPVVVHLHAVEILAHLVRSNCEKELNSLLENFIPWIIVDYYKPGQILVAEVNKALAKNRTAKVIFLKNHGVVIGGANVDEIRQILRFLIAVLSTPVNKTCPSDIPISLIDRYAPAHDTALHRLALDARLFKRLQTDWALYPDHVVFLGPNAHLYQSWDDLKKVLALTNEFPEQIFIRDKGVFVTNIFSKAKAMQLRCYYDILIRQPHDAKLQSLSQNQIMDLLNWDAEKYRMRRAKQ